MTKEELKKILKESLVVKTTFESYYICKSVIRKEIVTSIYFDGELINKSSEDFYK
jgi:uncharacterized protein YqgQ